MGSANPISMYSGIGAIGNLASDPKKTLQYYNLYKKMK